MITRTEKIRQTPFWQRELAHAIQDIDELLEFIHLDRAELAVSDAACKQFSLRIPIAYAERIKKADALDPLLRQILPVSDEMQTNPGFTHDPVSDQQSIVAQGLLQKYHGRALLITTGACAIHCRYCFRRHFPYNQSQASIAEWSDSIEYLRNKTDITEIILSGGDPLTLSDTRLTKLIHKIESIAHIKTLRIHTRLPIVLPSRVCSKLLEWIKKSRLNIVIVVHCNHANEIDFAVTEALQKLKNEGVTLLNQSVLLAGINDTIDALQHLSESLFSAGVLPYYLHLLDPVAGAAHFDVNKHQATRLIQDLQARLPGYLVPRLVQEIAGEPSKTPAFP